MGILNIREAEREGARLVIGLSGLSGEGKTYTALQLAWGLANFNAKKVGLLDTENRRGSLYADSLKDGNGNVHRFLIGDLDAPFSPDRYKQAILEFQTAGVEVLVIDSVSHEWEGTGGCEEIATLSEGKIANWKLAKAKHKMFMNTLLQCDMHVIACIRAREKTDFTNPKSPKSLGVQPIQEKNFAFELTASLMMWEKGRAQQLLKCPEELLPVLGRGNGYITPKDGKALRDWVDGAKAIDPNVERARNHLRTQTENGVAAVQAAWRSLPEAIRRKLNSEDAVPAEILASAKAYDEQKAVAAKADNELDDLNAQVAQAQATEDKAKAVSDAIIASVRNAMSHQDLESITRDPKVQDQRQWMRNKRPELADAIDFEISSALEGFELEGAAA
ncbi:MAG: AAA domain protein [Caudoviricetes sp.]|nr:MAG: AAA domain protein [Caudoviricetes sp.]